MEASDTAVNSPAPYFAFKTLTNMLVKMEEHGPPRRIDRSFLGNMSNAGQTQFIAGLKSLGLIDENGVVGTKLSEMVKHSDDRPVLVGQLVRERYPEAVELGKTNATTAELVEVFRTHYAVQGDTARKAIAFFLQASAYAGDIQISPHFKTPSNRTANGPRRRPRVTGTDTDLESTPANVTNTPSGLHPAVLTLVQALPAFADGVKPEYSTAEREAWFAYARATFNLIYALPEGDTGGNV